MPGADAMCPERRRCVAAKVALFDHLVGNREDGRRKAEPKRFGCLGINAVRAAAIGEAAVPPSKPRKSRRRIRAPTVQTPLS